MPLSGRGAGAHFGANSNSRAAQLARAAEAGRRLRRITPERLQAALVAGGRQFDEAGNLMPLPPELLDPATGLPIVDPLVPATISPWVWVGGAVALGGVGYLLWRRYRK